MRKILFIVALFCSLSSANALTPFNLDTSKIKSCKLKFALKGGERLITSVLALDEAGNVVAEFGDTNGKAFETTEDLKVAKAYLIESGLCREIKSF